MLEPSELDASSSQTKSDSSTVSVPVQPPSTCPEMDLTQFGQWLAEHQAQLLQEAMGCHQALQEALIWDITQWQVALQVKVLREA